MWKLKNNIVLFAYDVFVENSKNIFTKKRERLVLVSEFCKNIRTKLDNKYKLYYYNQQQAFRKMKFKK